MIKLTEKKRDDAKSLLEDHQKLCDALLVVGKPGWERLLFLNGPENRGEDNVEIALNYDLTKRTLTEQKKWTEKELAKLGIELS